MDFGSRIQDATATKDASYGTYNQYAGQADQSKAQYDTAFGQRQGYGDIYDAARNKYMNTDEVNAAKGAYQNSRNAIDQINTTINKLPESISQQYGGTGLTEAQRARAMGQQQQQMGNTYNYLNTNYQNALGDYQDLSNKAMQETQNVAGGNYQSQQDALNAQQSVWNTLLGQRNTSYGQYQQDLAALGGVNSERDNWELNQQNMALERWKEEQANARAAADRNAELNLQKYLTQQQTEQANAAATLQQQLYGKQSKADYNKYVKETKAGAADKQQKAIDNWWGRMWDNEGVQSRAADDYRNSVNNMLTYDQWAGNV
jgi:hypothetical protein